MAKTAEKPLREKLKGDLEARYEKLLLMLDEGMTATKRVRMPRNCLKCGCKHIEFVEIPNTETALKVAEFFANQGFGRPGTSDEKVEASIVFTNKVILSDNGN